MVCLIHQLNRNFPIHQPNRNFPIHRFQKQKGSIMTMTMTPSTPRHRSDDMSEMSGAECINDAMGDPRCWYGETYGCAYHDPATYAGAHVALTR